MTTTSTTVPGVAGPYLDQQLHVLVDEDTRTVTLGLAALAARSTGRRPAEGDTVRRLILMAIAHLHETDPQTLESAISLGRAEILRRRALASPEGE